MTIAPWIGNESTDWFMANGAEEQAVTGTSRIRGGPAQSANSNSFVMSPMQPPRTTAGIRFLMYSSNGASMGTNRAFFTLRNDADVPVFRLYITTTNVIQPQYWDGATWVGFDTAKGTGWNTGVLGTVELFIDGCGTTSANATIRIYINSALSVEWSGSNLDFTDVTNISRLYFGNMFSVGTYTLRIGEAVIQDGNPAGTFVFGRGPIGNGVDVGGTGDYTTVDEFPLSTADFNALTNVGDRRSVVFGTFDLLNRRVTGAQFAVRASCGVDGPQAIKLYVTVAGTRYFSPSLPLTVTDEPRGYCWPLNPATGLRWTNAELNAAEYGWEAA